MYVDRYRFALEPQALVGADDGPLRALLRNPRRKAGVALRYLRAFWPILKAYRALGDAASRGVFLDLLRYKLLGGQFTSLANNREMYEALEAAMAAEPPSENPPCVMQNALGETIRLWLIDYCGVPLKVLTSKLGRFWLVHSKQYYYRTDKVAIEPEAGDVLIDGGAFLGEMSMQFGVDVGPDGRVDRFDPFPRHAQLAADNAALNGLADHVHFFAAGLASKSSVSGLEPIAQPGGDSVADGAVNAGRRLGSGDATVAIDDFCDWSGLDRVDYIKMDIEGSEIDALDGCRRTIEKWHPKLAICVYHRFDDLWAITNLVHERYPFYDLYMGHYTLHSEETVLYAIDRGRRLPG